MPPCGYYPKGSFQSSTRISAQFCSEAAKKHKNERLLASMPFLYQLHLRLLTQSTADENNTNHEQENEADLYGSTDNPLDAEGLGLEEITYQVPPNPIARKQHRLSSIARVVCCMVASARNRRCNSFQLQNSIQLLACGVTERVNQWPLYHELANSRRTATLALKTLSSEAKAELKKMFESPLARVVSPIICIDNLDIEQHVHTHSIGHQTRMFHGTWGYVHFPSPEFINTLDTSQLNLDSFNKAMKKLSLFQIEPSMFLPTPEEEESYKAVWESQIAQVLNTYNSKPENREQAICLDPPPIEKISSKPPIIKILQLMDTPENSAEGLGQVIDATVQQTGLSREAFFAQLQLMDGDLATCKNFNSLRSLHVPSSYAHHSLENISFQLSASHTLWNIAAAILKAHLGDTNNSLDVGAWRCLENLGIPHTKAIPQTDFLLMIKHMEQVHEATILHGLKFTMVDKDPIKGLGKISTKKWNFYVDQFYDKYCTGEARAKAATLKDPKLHNTLIRLQEFLTLQTFLRDMMHSFRADTGATVFTQSHHNIMSPKSLNVFLQMARNFDILNEPPGSLAPKEKVKKVQNSYVFGISKFKQQIDKDPNLNRYKQHMNPMAMEIDTDVGEEHNQQEEGTETREEQSRYAL
ncbi:hypothetical protein PCASD_00776 [Puccinia coronata f. sp. avenae]|uniref:DUF6589 domain-containing protein n=1 Tax=Puccinia coronata f. sp. avenae TaxID=200324 RepID=A0A2N5VKZ3_9BASI|nr:hypothetical protein PCASD_00776 [Puccinia coronata f. sp. avenae]